MLHPDYGGVFMLATDVISDQSGGDSVALFLGSAYEDFPGDYFSYFGDWTIARNETAALGRSPSAVPLPAGARARVDRPGRPRRGRQEETFLTASARGRGRPRISSSLNLSDVIA